jgi:hypothetical protein
MIEAAPAIYVRTLCYAVPNAKKKSVSMAADKNWGYDSHGKRERGWSKESIMIISF